MPKIDKYRKRLNSLENKFESYKTHLDDIVQHLLPQHGLYLKRTDQQDSDRGKKKNQKIINNTPKESLRTLASGMHGGLTSPSRPWFVLTIDDEALKENQGVKDWLHDVRNIMFAALARSNFYDVIYSIYLELAAFGTAAMLIEEDFESIIRFKPLTIGSFYLAQDANQRVNTLYHKLSMTSEQLVEKFGEDKVSQSVLTCYQNGQKDKSFEIVQCIQPQTEPELAERFPYELVYYEKSGDGDNILLKSGYRNKPFVAPRWELIGDNIYGNSPGMDALGDIRMLQTMENKKLKGLDKTVDPPMNAPMNMKGKAKSVVAGAVNYSDVTQGQQGFQPTYQVSLDYSNIAFELDRVENRIRKNFFNDIFLTISSQQKQMTATEVARRHEERLMVFGPILERLNSELFADLIDRVYLILDGFGQIPEAPEELTGKEVDVEYVSILAQSQKAVSTGAIEQLLNFTGAAANLDPSAVNKVDVQESIDQYADLVGVPPKIVRSDVAVAAIEQQQAAQRAAAQAMQNSRELAETSKTLSDTELDKNSALDGIVEGTQ